ncbi:MAG: rhodanese-like domain-containing protein [Flavobacteriales bacterium]
MKKLIFPLATMAFVASCTSEKTHTETSTTSTTVTTTEGESTTTSSSLSTVDAATFKSEMESTPGTLLDVRTPEEVATGIIPGATVININDSDFETRIDQLDKTKPVYVYCKAGGRSARAADILKEKGFPVIVNLNGGIMAWTDKGFETAK